MVDSRVVTVTGGTGFVGTGVVPALLAAGYRVRALVRSSSVFKFQTTERLVPIVGDVTNAADIARALEGSSALVHLAGIRRKDTKRTGKTYEDIDVGSVRAACEAMKSKGMKRIVLLSAADIGDSEYVRCKRVAEQLVRDANLDWTFLRPSYIIGPGQMWPLFIGPIIDLVSYLPGHYGDVATLAGNVSREDLGKAIVWALANQEAIGRVLDVQGIRSVAR